jgi:hypothetical protein
MVDTRKAATLAAFSFHSRDALQHPRDLHRGAPKEKNPIAQMRAHIADDLPEELFWLLPN